MDNIRTRLGLPVEESIRMAEDRDKYDTIRYVYIDTIVDALVKSDLGCHVMGCLLYADNLILLSASVCKLQEMLNICYYVGSGIDMKFNARKSSLLCVGKHFLSNIDDLHVGNEDITWKDSIKYLGVWLCYGKRLI